MEDCISGERRDMLFVAALRLRAHNDLAFLKLILSFE